jgi:hypothetical protein
VNTVEEVTVKTEEIDYGRTGELLFLKLLKNRFTNKKGTFLEIKILRMMVTLSHVSSIISTS